MHCFGVFFMERHLHYFQFIRSILTPIFIYFCWGYIRMTAVDFMLLLVYYCNAIIHQLIVHSRNIYEKANPIPFLYDLCDLAL